MVISLRVSCFELSWVVGSDHLSAGDNQTGRPAMSDGPSRSEATHERAERGPCLPGSPGSPAGRPGRALCTSASPKRDMLSRKANRPLSSRQVRQSFHRGVLAQKHAVSGSHWTSPRTAMPPGRRAMTLGFSPRRADPIRSARQSVMRWIVLLAGCSSLMTCRDVRT